MEIFDKNGNKIENPDMRKGYLKETSRFVEHEAVIGVDEVWHYETLAVYPNGGKEVKKVVDVEGVEAHPAWSEEVPYFEYVEYTEDELKAMEEAKVKAPIESRIENLETKALELSETIDILLSGVTSDE